MTALLPREEIVHSPTGRAPDASVIWLHGLGADGHDFEPIVPELKLPDSMAVRFVFPHAPERSVTINMGMRMRSWYDILAMNEVRQIDGQQLEQSCEQLRDLIDHEISRGIASQRIVIAGFSQGGVVGLHTALRYPRTLAGILALSTYLPLAEQLEAGCAEANRNTLIFMAHGTQDPVVHRSLARQACDWLGQAGYRVEWHDYPMPHAVCGEQIADMSAWLLKQLEPVADS